MHRQVGGKLGKEPHCCTAARASRVAAVFRPSMAEEACDSSQDSRLCCTKAPVRRCRAAIAAPSTVQQLCNVLSSLKCQSTAVPPRRLAACPGYCALAPGLRARCLKGPAP